MQIKGEGEMIVYTKLWLLLKERGMKRTDLLNVISSATLAKLGKNDKGRYREYWHTDE